MLSLFNPQSYNLFYQQPFIVSNPVTTIPSFLKLLLLELVFKACNHSKYYLRFYYSEID